MQGIEYPDSRVTLRSDPVRDLLTPPTSPAKRIRTARTPANSPVEYIAHYAMPVRKSYARKKQWGVDRSVAPAMAWRNVRGVRREHVLGANAGKYGMTRQLADATQMQARVQDGYHGYGDYKQNARKFGAGALRAAGAGLGYAATGNFQGAHQGWRLGAKASKFAGWGDYASNQIINDGGSQPMSVNKSAGDMTGDVYINHREFISNIAANTANTFENRVFPINAGLSGSFPFLSQIAQNFTLYQFQGLIFEFVTTSGETSTSSNALGKVIMAVDYDPDASPFTNPVQMSNMDYAVSAKPSTNVRCGVETKPSQLATEMQFVRTGDGTRDKIFSDIGQFQIATDGVPSAGIIGELWVTYRVRLSRAQLSVTQFGSSIKYDAWLWSGSATTLATATDTTSLLSARSVNGLYTLPPGAPFARFTGGGDYLGGALTIGSAIRQEFRYTFPVKITSGFYKIQLFLGGPVVGSPPACAVKPSGAGATDSVGIRIVKRPEFPEGVVEDARDETATEINFVSSLADQSLLVTVIEIDTTSTIPASIYFDMTQAFPSTWEASLIITQVNASMGGIKVIN